MPMNTIMTVLGTVQAENCGLVLSHEHLFIDLRNQAAPDADSQKVTSADWGRLQKDPYCMKDNLLLDDFGDALQECRSLASLGCDTVVDCSLDEIGRNPLRLRRLAKESGMNIVMGCGWYTADTHTASVEGMSVAELAARLVSEIENGVGDTGVRPGIIGEIGTSKEILPDERKALKAAAHAQLETGLSIQVHIYPWSSNGLEALDILCGEGVSPRRIVICHSDVCPDRTYIKKLLDRGAYVQLDNFGKEFTPEEGGFAAGDFVKDAERAGLAAWICSSGHEEQLLLTNDICLKCMLSKYGGHGYSHVFKDVLPMLRNLGIGETTLRRLLHENPLRMLGGA